MEDRLEKNRRTVLQRVAQAARECGREAEELDVVAVTKTVEPALARILANLGSRDLGENRVPELERKVAAFRAPGVGGDDEVRWHFIGHVQRNKARRVVRCADVIHSVDSEQLLETLVRCAAEEERRPALFVQVKLADDSAKSGVARDAAPALVAAAAESDLPLEGLMAMAPFPGDDPATNRARARRTFDELAELARTLPADSFVNGSPRLSMGMSGDFAEAIAAGAHVLRIGSAFFEGIDRSAREAS